MLLSALQLTRRPPPGAKRTAVTEAVCSSSVCTSS
jgi:hypothetical protein